jgi:hypothetical protein
MHTFHQFVAEKNEKNQVICHGRRIKEKKKICILAGMHYAPRIY